MNIHLLILFSASSLASDIDYLPFFVVLVIAKASVF